MEELDFELEGENSERCYRELKHLNFVAVPRINWDLTSKVRNEVQEYVVIIALSHSYQCLFNIYVLESFNSRIYQWMSC